VCRASSSRAPSLEKVDMAFGLPLVMPALPDHHPTRRDLREEDCRPDKQTLTNRSCEKAGPSRRGRRERRRRAPAHARSPPPPSPRPRRPSPRRRLRGKKGRGEGNFLANKVRHLAPPARAVGRQFVLALPALRASHVVKTGDLAPSQRHSTFPLATETKADTFSLSVRPPFISASSSTSSPCARRARRGSTHTCASERERLLEIEKMLIFPPAMRARRR